MANRLPLADFDDEPFIEIGNAATGQRGLHGSGNLLLDSRRRRPPRSSKYVTPRTRCIAVIVVAVICFTIIGAVLGTQLKKKDKDNQKDIQKSYGVVLLDYLYNVTVIIDFPVAMTLVHEHAVEELISNVLTKDSYKHLEILQETESNNSTHFTGKLLLHMTSYFESSILMTVAHEKMAELGLSKSAANFSFVLLAESQNDLSIKLTSVNWTESLGDMKHPYSKQVKQMIDTSLSTNPLITTYDVLLFVDNGGTVVNIRVTAYTTDDSLPDLQDYTTRKINEYITANT